MNRKPSRSVPEWLFGLGWEEDDGKEAAGLVRDWTYEKLGVLVLFVLNARLTAAIEFDPLVGYEFKADPVDAVGARSGAETCQDFGR